ncbi:MAG: HlyD family secretion protein, partial [Pyrinomonadaceae bacterium]
MDIKRPTGKRKKSIRYALLTLTCVMAVVAITYGLSRLKPAAPSVSRSTVLTDRVKRGQMLRQVRGIGTLVPEEIRQIAAPVEGRVERIYAQPGEQVTAGTVLVELSNPTLRQAAVDVEYQIKAAEAELNSLRVRLENERMTQQSSLAIVQSEYNQAKIQLDTDEQLAKEGLVPQLTLRVERVRVHELANRHQIEQKRLESNRQGVASQVAAQQARIEQLRAKLRLNQEQVASQQVRAGTTGVLLQVTVEVGQQIIP